MKKQTSLLLTLTTIFILFTCCHSIDEKRLKVELAKKDSIIEVQNKIIDDDEKKDNYNLDKLKPIVVPKNSNIRLGDNYSAEIYLAAYYSKEPFEVYLYERLDTINNKMLGKIDTIKVINGVGNINIHPMHRGKNIIQGQLFYNSHMTKWDVGLHMKFEKEYNVY